MLNRPTEHDGVIYHHHAVTEIRHVVGRATRVLVRSFQDRDDYYIERAFEREYDDALTLDGAYSWIAGLPDFAEHVDERDAIISELAPTLTDGQAARVPWAYPAWEDGASYEPGERVSHDGSVYKCLQAHMSQADWTPDVASSLWANVAQPAEHDGGEVAYPEWRQPDSTNAYMAGDRVAYDGRVYESTIDGNVWSPADYPQGWQPVAEEGAE